MEPVTAVTAAITAGHHAISLLKGIADKIKTSGKAEGLSDLIDAQSALMELIQKHHEQILENVQLRERIRQLEAEKQRERDLHFDGEVYWSDKTATSQGPFCQICYDKDRKLVRLTSGADYSAKWRCAVCLNLVSRRAKPIPQRSVYDGLPGADAGG